MNSPIKIVLWGCWWRSIRLGLGIRAVTCGGCYPLGPTSSPYNSSHFFHWFLQQICTLEKPQQTTQKSNLTKPPI